jgi:TonB family protein
LKRARFLLPLLFAVSAYAQVDWELALTESTSALSSGRYMKAYVIDDRVLEDMLKRLGTDDPALFTTFLVHKAAALAGLGREDEARWYWSYAQFLDEEVAESAEVAALGRAGEILKRMAPRTSADTKRVGGAVKAPVAIKRIEPKYPEKARLLRISGIVILECTIDKSGVVRNGRVLKGLAAPTMAYAALEAVRRWQFQPATVDGEPVNVIFNLTINFKLVADEDEPKP